MATVEAGYEGQTLDAAVSVGNSGSNGDSPIESLTTGTGGAITYDDDHPFIGNRGIRFNQSTAANQCYVRYSLGADFTAIAFRFYITLDSLPSADVNFPVRVQTSAGAAVFQVLLRTTGFMRITNTAGTVVATATGTALAAGNTYRIEGQASGLGTSADLAVQAYLGNSTTALQSASATGAAVTAQGRFLLIGKTSSATLSDWYVDNVKATSGTSTPIGIADATQNVTGAGTTDSAEAVGTPTLSIVEYWTPSGQTEREKTDTAYYRVRVADWNDRAPGAATYGPTGGTLGSGVFSKMFVEVLGSSVSAGAQTVSPTGIASAQGVGVPNPIGRGTVYPAPTSIPSAEAFGTATIVPAPTALAPPSIPSEQALGDPTVAAGTATVTPTGIATGEAHGAATIARGAVTASPTGIASAQAFGTPSITSGTATITPSGVVSSESFGTATAIPGGIAIEPDPIFPDSGVGGPVVTAGARTAAPASIASGEAFGTASVAPGPVSVAPGGVPSGEAVSTAFVQRVVAPSGVPSGEAFGSPAITTVTAVAPSGIPSDQAFGTAAISRTIAASGIASGEAHGSATITPPAATISPTGVPSDAAFGAPNLGTGAQVSPTGLASAEAHGSATVTATVTLAASGVPSAEAHGSHVVMATYAVAPGGVPSAEAHGTAKITSNVTPSGIPSGQGFGASTVTAGPVSATATGIASGETHGTATITPVSTAAPSGVPSAQAVGTPSISVGPVVIAPSGVVTGEQFGDTEVAPQPWNIAVQSTGPVAAVGTPSITRGVVLIGPASIPSALAWGDVTVTVGAAPDGRDVIVLASLGPRERAVPVLGARSLRPGLAPQPTGRATLEEQSDG